MEEGPDDALVAGRRCQGAVVAVEASQIFGEQRADFKGRDVDLLICREKKNNYIYIYIYIMPSIS